MLQDLRRYEQVLFTDNVQRNISRYVQVYRYRDCYDICYKFSSVNSRGE